MWEQAVQRTAWRTLLCRVTMTSSSYLQLEASTAFTPIHHLNQSVFLEQGKCKANRYNTISYAWQFLISTKDLKKQNPKGKLWNPKKAPFFFFFHLAFVLSHHRLKIWIQVKHYWNQNSLNKSLNARSQTLKTILLKVVCFNCVLS